MFNPTSASKTPLSSRVALSFALLLAGIFGLVATIVLPTGNFKKTSPRLASLPATAKSLPVMVPPTPGEIPKASAEELIAFCSANVSETRSFVVFRRGTCVIINEPCKDPLAEARRLIAACVEPDVRFLAESTSDGDVIVSFKEPVFHRFSQAESAKLSPWLEFASAALLTPAEAIVAGDHWTPGGNARFGLLARRRMLEDSVDTVPVRIIRARKAGMEAN